LRGGLGEREREGALVRGERSSKRGKREGEKVERQKKDGEERGKREK